ncbi:MAG: exopolysaccharide biosynthesis polyprenyl glycosylphosphotransferase [Acetobacteraceae bacterium]|nr:exopolysaccharide biosynthesis polyprenyl glycosylphosphotransferase [Acetobacteraceae bacterium]
MTRLFGRYVPVEMTVLATLESLLCFGALYATLIASSTGRLAVDVIDVGLANRAALLAGIIGLSAIAIGLYRPEVCLDRRRLLLNAAVAAILAFPAALLVSGEFGDGPTRAYAVALVKVLGVWITFAVAARSLVSTLLSQIVYPRRMLLVGSGTADVNTWDALRSGRGRLYEFAGTKGGSIDIGGLTPEQLRQSRIWGIVVTGGGTAGEEFAAREQERLIDCRLRGVRVYDDASFWEQHLGRVNLERLKCAWFLRGEGFRGGWLSLLIKRVIDVIASGLLLAFTFPLMLTTAILIKLDSPGPVFYRQARVGLHGKVFTLFKFRSMRTDAEAAGTPRWATKSDSRITRIGALIRQTRLDELPQLLNVFRGEMSLIGPRPERPHFVEQLAAVIPFYSERSYVKPGITGWAQVNYPYGASVEDAREKLSYDLYYVKHRSTMLDLLILMATVRVILFREGAR